MTARRTRRHRVLAVSNDRHGRAVVAFGKPGGAGRGFPSDPDFFAADGLVPARPIHVLADRGVGIRSLANLLPINTSSDGHGSGRFPAPGLFAEMKRTFTAKWAAHVCATEA